MPAQLGRVDLLLIAAAAIGPAFSLATTYGPMVAAGGSGTPLALALVTAIMICIALAYRRLGERYPSAGSAYTWVRVAFGPVAGAYAAWVLIVANIFAVVVTAVPAGAYTLALAAPALAGDPRAGALVGTLWVLGAGALLWRGIVPTSRVANALAVAELAVLSATALWAGLHPVVRDAVASAPLPPFAALAGAVVIGIWMTDGWEVSASTAEEAADAAHGPGDGGLVGLLLTAVVLGACMLAFARVGTSAGFADHSADSMAYVADALGGGPWRIAVSATVLVSLAAALQTTLIYLTRSLYAMGRDGTLPPGIGRLDDRGQPAVAVVALTALGMAMTALSGFSPTVRAALDFVLSGTSFFLGVLFALSAAAAVRLFAPERSVDGVILPAVATAALALVLALAFAQSDPPTRLLLLVLAAAGLPVALWRGRFSATTL